MNPAEEAVGRYYDDVIFAIERVRLVEEFPVELAITRRRLERHIASGAVVAEIGVGGGLYSELLARRGAKLHLVDISHRLLDVSIERLRAADLSQFPLCRPARIILACIRARAGGRRCAIPTCPRSSTYPRI
jgi:ubiquinone/menaquinone biosynthesis C-methylase UbiE